MDFIFPLAIRSLRLKNVKKSTRYIESHKWSEIACFIASAPNFFLFVIFWEFRADSRGIREEIILEEWS